MPTADDIRRYCITSYIAPARSKGENIVEITVGKVHRELNMKNRLPHVCAALGANVFEEESGTIRLNVKGPLNGATTRFFFLLVDPCDLSKDDPKCRTCPLMATVTKK